MKTPILHSLSRWLAASLGPVSAALLAQPLTLTAFPPAPDHVIYGMVRDEYGTPLNNAQGYVLLQTSSGTTLAGTITPGLGAAVNYQVCVPMDSGVYGPLYSTNALKAATPFKLVVVIGGTTNLPIQMSGNFDSLGQPGQRTRLDLTLGVDSNGNGIPDSWEAAFLAALGLNLDPSTLQAGIDYTGDGLTLRQEFLAGYYPFDPGDSFRVSLVGLNGVSPLLQISTITGRSYTPLGSADLKTWVPMAFTIPAEGSHGPVHSYYYAPDIRTLQIQAIQPASGPALRFFRLVLQ